MILVSFSSITIDVTSRAETANPFEAHEFTPGFQQSSYCLIFSFLCSILQIIAFPFVFFYFGCLSFFRFTASDFPFDIFKLFFGTTLLIDISLTSQALRSYNFRLRDQKSYSNQNSRHIVCNIRQHFLPLQYSKYWYQQSINRYRQRA